MTYEKYLATHNLESLPASQIPKLLGCNLSDLSFPPDHFCLLGRDGKPLELHFEIYKSVHNKGFATNIKKDAQKYGFEVLRPEGLDWYAPGNTVKYIFKQGSTENSSCLLFQSGNVVIQFE